MIRENPVIEKNWMSEKNSVFFDFRKAMEILHFDTITSTNDYVKEKDFPDEILVIAKSQTKGRGRVGHEFYSPLGGLYFSYGFYDKEELSNLTLIVGKIVLSSMSEYSGESLSIKGINDIMWKGKKVAGILCEHIMDKYVVGIGINTGKTSFPEDLKAIAACIDIKDKEGLIFDIVQKIKDEKDN